MLKITNAVMAEIQFQIHFKANTGNTNSSTNLLQYE